MVAGVLSITGAAIFSFALLSKAVERMVSLSVGIMLATSLLHALPSAFESGADPRSLFATLLGGLLAFFVLEKLAILRHSHHHEGDGHHHAQRQQVQACRGRCARRLDHVRSVSCPASTEGCISWPV